MSEFVEWEDTTVGQVYDVLGITPVESVPCVGQEGGLEVNLGAICMHSIDSRGATDTAPLEDTGYDILH